MMNHKTLRKAGLMSLCALILASGEHAAAIETDDIAAEVESILEQYLPRAAGSEEPTPFCAESCPVPWPIPTDPLEMFDLAIDDGTLTDNPAAEQLEAQLGDLRVQLEQASAWQLAGELEEACQLWLDAFWQAWPQSPPYTVSGPAAPDLANLIADIAAGVNCPVLAMPGEGNGLTALFGNATIGTSLGEEGAVQGDYVSELLKIPDGEAILRSVQASVALSPALELWRPEPLNVEDPVGSMEDLQVDAELVDASGDVVPMPVDESDQAMSATAQPVPGDIDALQLTVTSQDPSLTYYPVAMAFATQPVEEVIDSIFKRVQASLEREENEEFDYSGALEALEEARELYAEILALVEMAVEEELAEARALLDEALARLEQARESQQAAIDELEQLREEGAAGVRKALELAEHLLTQASVIPDLAEAHLWLLEHTGYEMPAVTVGIVESGSDGVDAPIYDAETNTIVVTNDTDISPSVLRHQFGHAALLHQTGIALLEDEAALSSICESVSEATAWSEGFASFLGQATLGNPFYQDLSLDFSVDLETREALHGDVVLACNEIGEAVMLNVAATLWDVFDGEANAVPDADEDGLSVPFETIWECLDSDAPESLQEMLDCIGGELEEQDSELLEEVAGENLGEEAG
jgi:tetratricopeptide (TPR) repeat protein